MKGDWLLLMYFCFTDAILSKVCKTKFSNTSFEALLPVLKCYEISSEFLLSQRFKSRFVNICGFCF